jgi:DNA/RNA non-specific endonuclease
VRSNVVAYAFARTFSFPAIANQKQQTITKPLRQMKPTKSLSGIFSLLFVAAIFLSACSSDNGNSPNDDNGNTIANNKNSNLKDGNQYTHRLEFPKLKGGRNIVVTHIDQSTDEVNYSVEWDGEKKSNRWTCYQLYQSNSKWNVGRWYGNPQYPSDPLIPSSMAFSYDPYWNTGYDHGHLCPSADRRNTNEAQKQTFYISNMQPQLSAFNGSAKGGGIWLTMENKIRAAFNINSKDTMFICRGGTIDESSKVKAYLRNGFIVPGYFFSAALMKYYNYAHKKWEYKAIGFWFKHENNQETSLKPYVVNIKELEELTHIDFFCNLPDDIEKKIESIDKDIVIKLWNINK